MQPSRDPEILLPLKLREIAGSKLRKPIGDPGERFVGVCFAHTGMKIGKNHNQIRSAVRDGARTLGVLQKPEVTSFLSHLTKEERRVETIGIDGDVTGHASRKKQAA